MDQRTIEIILKFFMARLPESDLRDLDALLEGGSLDTPQPARASTPAMDQALGSVERQEFMRIGPRARNALRRSRLAAHRGMAADSAEGLAYAERFPHADRLAG